MAMVDIPPEEAVLNTLGGGQSASFYFQIMDKIRGWIRRGLIREGEELPSERELAELFGVSRQPVGQALKTLEYLGVVRSYRGRGMVVKNIDLEQVLRHTEFIQLDSEQGRSDLHETREALEVQAAKLAAARRTPEDLERLAAALKAMEDSIRHKKYVPETSVQFHTAIVLASHNLILRDLDLLLGRLLGETRPESLRNETQRALSLRQHQLIFEAIRDQDQDAAGARMLEHLGEVWHSLSEPR